jgi:hypothetical protein
MKQSKDQSNGEHYSSEESHGIVAFAQTKQLRKPIDKKWQTQNSCWYHGYGHVSKQEQ